MLRLLWVLPLVLFVSCSKESKESPPGFTPDLTIKALNNECLDLQSAVEHMDASEFVYPGFVYTRNFEILSSSGSDGFKKTLIARSFRADRVQMRTLGDLRGLKQTECESVRMPDAAGVPLTYRITGYSTTHLELELDRKLAEAELESLPSAHRDTIKKFPSINRYVIRIPSSRRLELTSEYKSVPVECPNVGSLQIRETLVYNWVGAGEPDTMARLDPTFHQRLSAIAGEPTPIQPVQPAPQPTPEPVPEEPAPELPTPEEEPAVPQPVPAGVVPASTDSTDGLIELGPEASQALIQVLQGRPYARCR